MWRLALANALMELDQRYRRTFIGKWWIALTFLLFVGVKVVIFGALNDVSLEFFAPYLAMGYMLFRFMSQSVTGGAGVFISSQSWIKTEPLPLSVHLLSFLAKNFVMIGFMSLPALALCLWAGRYSLVALYSLPFVVLLYAVNHYWVSCLLGVIASRYRDVVHMLVTIMQVLYFATPILWVPTETGVRAWAALFNPLTHYIAVLRDPMMYGTVPWLSWAIVLSVTAIGCVMAMIVFVRYRTKLVYWI